jgi:hypothetical protein
VSCEDPARATSAFASGGVEVSMREARSVGGRTRRSRRRSRRVAPARQHRRSQHAAGTQGAFKQSMAEERMMEVIIGR